MSTKRNAYQHRQHVRLLMHQSDKILISPHEIRIVSSPEYNQGDNQEMWLVVSSLCHLDI